MSSQRKRIWIFAPLLFGLLGSTCTHGSLLVALLFGASTGHAGGGGENGHAGAGDTTVDVSVAANTAAPNPPVEAPTTPPPPPHEDAIEPAPVVQKHLPTQPAPPTTSTAEETRSGKLAGPTRIGLPDIGFGGDTVEGQRALLPAATTCTDPVAGRWEALKYSPVRGDWVRFTLTIQRESDGALHGTIGSHTWSGTMFDRTPPGCAFGGFDITVSMNASGRADGGHITFGASRYSVIANRCISFGSDYAPDHFSGTIDVARQEFQSLNNDGFRDVNAPYVFRRTGCL